MLAVCAHRVDACEHCSNFALLSSLCSRKVWILMGRRIFVHAMNDETRDNNESSWAQLLLGIMSLLLQLSASELQEVYSFTYGLLTRRGIQPVAHGFSASSSAAGATPFSSAATVGPHVHASGASMSVDGPPPVPNAAPSPRADGARDPTAPVWCLCGLKLWGLRP